ncbi:DgyrCDS2272 [Dimorphilus gyrociliatus]|uniref:DgyrCDS2272 n=1 Tax=Dimorphilus gyrociliatus TaxID=2664684 RepID=A0A7I8VCV0_9ANNE|nr:DgyrCDS2272 [Dimorphilus gyrociliatus]
MSYKSESANRNSNCDKTFNLRIKLGNNFRNNECVSGKGLSEESASEAESEENRINNLTLPMGQRKTHRTFQSKANKSATDIDEDALLVSREKSLIKDLNYCRVCKYKLSGRKHDNHFQTHRHKILEHFYDLCVDKGIDWGDMNARSFTCALHPDRFISSVEIMVKHCNRQHPDIVKSLNLPISNIWKTRLENQLGKDVVETELTNYTEENTNVRAEEPEKLNLKLKPTNSPHQIFACSKCSYRNFQRISVLKHIIQKHNLTAGMAGKFIIKTSKIIKSMPNKNSGPKRQSEARTLNTDELDKYRVKGNMSVKCMQVMDATLQHYSQFQPKNLQYVSNRLREEFIRFAKNQKKHNENGFYYCPTCKHKYPTVKSGKQHILRIAHSKNFFSEEYRTRYKILEAYANYNENNEFIGMVGSDVSNKSRSSKERSVSSVEDAIEGEKRKVVKEKIVKPKAIKRVLPTNSTPIPTKVATKDWDRINTPDSLNLGLYNLSFSESF